MKRWFPAIPRVLPVRPHGRWDGAFPRQAVQHLRTVTPEKLSGHLLRSHPLGDSRKSSPAASERRRSFWPFFFGEKEKGRKKRKNKNLIDNPPSANTGWTERTCDDIH